MSNLKKFNQMFEADIKNNIGLPKDYINDVEQKGKDKYDGGFDMMQSMQAMQDVFMSQQGHEKELVDAVKEIILDEYGSILDGVELDLKIVKPDDEEKREMTDKFIQTPEDAKFELETELEEDGNEIEVEADINEIEKRKLLNILMQGEALNVHELLHNNREKLNSIVPDIVEKAIDMVDIQKFAYWDENLPKIHELDKMPTPPGLNARDMANAMEVEYDENGEGGIVPKIKVRAMDITMVIHETVKGIYELIMANALPSDDADEKTKLMFKKVITETDTLKDEHEDIQYGEFIAADLRDYTNRFLGENYPDTKDIPNIREFVYGGLAKMKAKLFLDFMRKVLTGDTNSADRILKNENIVENIIKEFDEYANPTDDDLYIDEEDNNILDYSDMSPSELQSALDAAIDDGDFETAEEIGKFL